MEEWKDISGCPGYAVSNLGKVRSMKKTLIPCPNTVPRYYVKIMGKNRYIHHLVYETFVGPRDKQGWEVDHINRNPQDNRLENLRYVDKSTNRLNRDMPLGVSSQRYIHIETLKDGSTTYRLRIIRFKKSIIDKRFTTLEEACTERDLFICRGS